MAIIRAGDRILFQGDSITDAGRRDPVLAPLGGGYVAMVAGMLAARRPELRATVINRGIGGDRSAELLARWQADCLDLKPQVLSIKVGVNDVWRKLGEWNGQKHIPLPEFQANLRRLCEQARGAGIRDLVLVSPTTIDQDNAAAINGLLGEYAGWLRGFAREQGAVYVDARTPLLAARAASPDIPWTSDGCHPTAAGHALIAAAWYDAVVAG
jgi:lysophospholipase L1-like esterase